MTQELHRNNHLDAPEQDAAAQRLENAYGQRVQAAELEAFATDSDDLALAGRMVETLKAEKALATRHKTYTTRIDTLLDSGEVATNNDIEQIYDDEISLLSPKQNSDGSTELNAGVTEALTRYRQEVAQKVADKLLERGDTQELMYYRDLASKKISGKL